MAEKGENNPKPTRRMLKKKEYIQFAIQETSRHSEGHFKGQANQQLKEKLPQHP